MGFEAVSRSTFVASFCAAGSVAFAAALVAVPDFTVLERAVDGWDGQRLAVCAAAVSVFFCRSERISASARSQ